MKALTAFSLVLCSLVGPRAGLSAELANKVVQIRPAMPPQGKAADAVKRSLNWLKKHQNPDGSWGDSNKGAMTGFSLLAFLAFGETPASFDYGGPITKAVDWILDSGGKVEGRLHMGATFNQSGVYEHAICTYALSEYYGITRDERVVPLLRQAVGYIVAGQGKGGGWMYSYDKTADDLSVSGWQIQALRSAQLSKLEIPGVDAALRKAMTYLEKTKGPKGGYGYRGPADKYSLTGTGIYCRLMGGADRVALRPGMDWLLSETDEKWPVKYRGEAADLYAWYYHTRACLLFGGAAWEKWNRWFQDELVNSQSPDGSWPVPGGKAHGPQSGDSMTGRVYRTALCALTLEVIWRQLPTLRN